MATSPVIARRKTNRPSFGNQVSREARLRTFGSANAGAVMPAASSISGVLACARTPVMRSTDVGRGTCGVERQERMWRSWPYTSMSKV
jgi:hypothetical protein